MLQIKEKPEFFPILLAEVDAELENAIHNFASFHSLHEGYAVLLEEIDELWEHVKMKQSFRDSNSIHKECIQIAAMACRIILDLKKYDYKK